MPTEPPGTRWRLPPADAANPDGIVALGADLAPGTLLSTYRRGIFPMPVDGIEPMVWWSPDPRAILPLDRLRISRSLQRSCRRYDIRVSTAFASVVDACADPRRPGGWITAAMREAFLELHRLGWAHSVEAWSGDGELAGGLYGVAVGGLFSGESMFHRRADASKAALVALVSMLAREEGPRRLLDVQWRTDHLARLGAVELARTHYLNRLADALELPAPAAFTARPQGPRPG